MNYLLTFCCVLEIFFSPYAAECKEWIDLFNGTSLKGWHALKHPESFIIIDSSICANSVKGMDHLVFIGNNPQNPQIFKNFELEIICKGKPNSNSGIFFHTGTELSWWTLLKDGYEVQLNNTPKDKRKTGSLYDVRDVYHCPVDDTQWFQVNITVQDNHIIIELNGKVIVDYFEPKNPKRSWRRKNRLLKAEGGLIAIQAHDPSSTWYFKDIRIKKL